MADVVDNETPTRNLNDDELFARLQGFFQTDWDHHLEWVNGVDDENGGAKEDYEMVSGRQWDEKALDTLRAQNRPASVFDRIAPMIDAVCGNEVSNRQEVRYIPRKLGDSGVNETLTDAAKWFRDLSDAEDEESDAFRDAAIAGKGWTETRIDYEGEDPNGLPVISRVSPFEICVDRDACKPNYVDRRRTWRVRRLSIDDALSIPGLEDAEPSDLHAGWASDTNLSVEKTGIPKDYHGDSDEHASDPECVIIECQWWEREPFVRYVDPATGQIQEMEQDKFSILMERLTSLAPEQMMIMGIQPPASPVTQYRKVYRRAYIGKKLLATVPMPVEGHFTYKAITGKRDQNRNHFVGLVRPMKDPARWTNKLFSQIMHILNSNAKGGIMAERGAFEDDKQAAESWAKGDAITWMNNNGIAKVQPKQQTQFPQGHSQMLEFSMGAMPLVTGINQEFLGMRDATQPGVLEYQRKQAGMAILAPLFDSLRRYRKDQGRLMLVLIQEFLSDGRMVKIAGQGAAKYIPLLKDTTMGEYDVIVDEAPTSPNAKERDWQVLQPFLQMLLPQFASNPKLAESVLSRSPLPESVVQSILQSMHQQQPTPPSPDEILAKNLAVSKQIAEIESTQADTEDSQASSLGRKARALKDISDITAPFLAGDLPLPQLPMAPPYLFAPQQPPQQQQMPMQPQMQPAPQSQPMAPPQGPQQPIPPFGGS